jgi:hypothetical protein
MLQCPCAPDYGCVLAGRSEEWRLELPIWRSRGARPSPRFTFGDAFLERCLGQNVIAAVGNRHERRPAAASTLAGKLDLKGS